MTICFAGSVFCATSLRTTASLTFSMAANQPRGLRPAEPGHVLNVGPQKPFRAPPLKWVLVMAEQALNPAANFRAAATFRAHTLRGREKCLDLNQAQLLCSKHADHPSSACPLRLLQAHLALDKSLVSLAA